MAFLYTTNKMLTFYKKGKGVFIFESNLCLKYTLLQANLAHTYRLHFTKQIMH